MDQDSWLTQLAFSSGARFWSVAFNELTYAEQVFCVVWGLVGEVDNGGFEQYFFNSSGDIAWFAPVALHEIGAAKTANIVRRACDLFPGGSPSADRDARQAQLSSIIVNSPERLDKCDQEFYASSDDIMALLYVYATAHRAEIAGTDSM